MSEQESKPDNGGNAAEEGGVPTLVTPLTPLVHQVGNHVMAALSQPETVAVLTTITGSRNGQQVISIPLSTGQMQEVNEMLHAVEVSEEPEQIDCVGFHCYLKEEN